MKKIEIIIPEDRLSWAYWRLMANPDCGPEGERYHSPEQQNWLDWASSELHKYGLMGEEPMTDSELKALMG